MTIQEFSDSLNSAQREFLINWIDGLQATINPPAEVTINKLGGEVKSGR